MKNFKNKRSWLISLALTSVLGTALAQSAIEAACYHFDLSLTKKADKKILNAGEKVTFTLQVYNRGQSSARGVLLSDMLPKGFKFVDSSVPVWRKDTTDSRVNTYYFNVGTVKPRQVKTVTITAQGVAPDDIQSPSIDSHFDYKNIAQVAAVRDHWLDPDSRPHNCNYKTIKAGYSLEDDCAYVRVPVKKTVHPGSPASCDQLYALVASPYHNGSIYGKYIQKLNTTNTLTGSVIHLPRNYHQSTSATLALSPDGQKFFSVDDRSGALLMYDTAKQRWSATGKFHTSSRMVRMGVTSTGVGYAMNSGGYLWSFDMSGRITPVGTLRSLSSGAPDFYQNGDFFATADGKLYMLSAATGGQVSLWFVDPTDKTAEYLGNLDSAAHSVQYNGLAATSSGIFAANSAGQLAKVDVLNVKMKNVGGSHGSSTDLASCYYPAYKPKLGSTKTVENMTRPGDKVARPGDTLKYTIRVRNSGTLPAGRVTLRDELPKGTSYVPNSARVNGFTRTVLDGRSIDLSGAQYPLGQQIGICSKSNSACRDQVLRIDNTPNVLDNEAEVTFMVKVNNPFKQKTLQVANQGFVEYNDGQPTPVPIPTDDPGTPELGDPTIVPVVMPQLTISKDSNGPWMVGQSGAKYRLKVTNASKIDSIGQMVVKDLLPQGITLAGTPSLPVGWTLKNQNGLVTLTSQNVLKAGKSVTLELPVQVGQVSGHVINKASVGGGGDPDDLPNPKTCQPGTSNPKNQCAIDKTPVQNPPAQIEALKTVRKITGQQPVPPGPITNETVYPGDTLEYRIVVRNTGKIDAKAVTFEDLLPKGTSYVPDSAKINGYTSTVLNGRPVDLAGAAYPLGQAVGICSSSLSTAGPCTTQVLKPDNTPKVIDHEAVIVFRVKVDDPFLLPEAKVRNQGIVKTPDSETPTDDPTTPTPDDPTVTPVFKPVKLQPIKTVQNISAGGPVGASATGKPGDILEYCIVTKNRGSAGAKDITFVDPIPANTAFVMGSYGQAKDIKYINPANKVSYLTAKADQDIGEVLKGRVLVKPQGLTLAPGQRFSVCFRAVIK